MCVSRTEEETVPVWERDLGEPGNWCARFEVYRLLGPSRTLAEAHRRCARQEGLHAKSPGQAWQKISRRWAWRERAETWDHAERERLRALEEQVRFHARQRRLEMIGELMGMVFQALRRADLDGLDSDEAREWLPTMRMLLKDLLNVQRVELGMPGESAAGDSQAAPFTADELLAAQRELEAWRQREAESVTDASEVPSASYS